MQLLHAVSPFYFGRRSVVIDSLSADFLCATNRSDHRTFQQKPSALCGIERDLVQMLLVALSNLRIAFFHEVLPRLCVAVSVPRRHRCNSQAQPGHTRSRGAGDRVVSLGAPISLFKYFMFWQQDEPHGQWPPQPDRARGDGPCGPLQELG